jgi:hypothetical protein
MISRTGRGGFMDWLAQTPGAQEYYDVLEAKGWTEQEIVYEMIRVIQSSPTHPSNPANNPETTDAQVTTPADTGEVSGPANT